MTEDDKRILLRLRTDFAHYSKKCLHIRNKSGGVLSPFVFNKAQKHINDIVKQQKLATGKVRVIIMKGRQQGCSTYVEGRFYWLCTNYFGMRAFILTHDIDATNNLFDMAKRYHENCPDVVRPALLASNAKELLFDGIDSGYKLGTAGNKAVGRSSTIQLLHGSEVAYWPHAAEHAKGIMQAVPNEKGTEIFIESTANGLGNYFHEQWQLAESGRSQFINIFLPWWWQNEYNIYVSHCNNDYDDFKLTDEETELKLLYGLSNSNLNWRRNKIIELSVGGADGTKAFMQEYPCNSTEAFQTSGEDTYIMPSIVMVARKANAEKYGGVIVGVDPARFGDDRTSIIRRANRCAYGLESYTKKDTMEVVGIVHRIIVNEHPFKVCIDIGGLGAGIFDRLCELGHRDCCIAVNGGATPLNQKKYYNKRAEMWGEMNAWLHEQPATIPDSDSLHADICGIKYKIDSNSRVVLEKKEDMKKRGLRSPDEAEALALTFCVPSSAMVSSKSNEYKAQAQNIMGEYNRIDRLRKKAYS